MKTITHVILFSLMSVCLLTAQQTEKTKLSIQATNGIKDILAIFSTVNSKEKHTQAQLAYGQKIKPLIALAERLKQLTPPNDAEINHYVQEIVKQEKELAKIMKNLKHNRVNSDGETKTLLSVSLKQLNREITPLAQQIERLYPQSKMGPLIEKERQKQASKE